LASAHQVYIDPKFSIGISQIQSQLEQIVASA